MHAAAYNSVPNTVPRPLEAHTVPAPLHRAAYEESGSGGCST